MKILIVGKDGIFCEGSVYELIEDGFEAAYSNKILRGYDLYFIDADTFDDFSPCKKAPVLTFSGVDGRADFLRPFDIHRFESKACELLGIISVNDRSEAPLIPDGVTLSQTERKILTLLLERRGEIVSRGEILKTVFGTDDERSNIVSVYINYIRKKIETGDRRVIVNIKGVGYKINK